MSCRYCYGAGLSSCLYCDQPPPMPEPLVTFKTDDPAQMELAKNTIGGPALEKAFGPGGGGVDEILENCRRANQIIKNGGDNDGQVRKTD